jgi:hypothetical protein
MQGSLQHRGTQTGKTTAGILQTNDKGLNNSWERLWLAGTEDGEEGLQHHKDVLENAERALLISQRGIGAR